MIQSETLKGIKTLVDSLESLEIILRAERQNHQVFNKEWNKYEVFRSKVFKAFKEIEMVNRNLNR